MMNKLTYIKHYTKENVRALYGRLGKQSGLNPGVMWPRKEELKYLKQYDQAFRPELQELITENETNKARAREDRIKREQEVFENMQRLPGELKKFFDKVDQRQKERQAWIDKREALVEEVRDLLGYRAKPTDERFQEAVKQKEEEEIKAKKKEAKKKRENASLDEMLGTAKRDA